MPEMLQPDVIQVISYNAALSLPYYREQLHKTNRARFAYMTSEERGRTRGRLYSTLALLRCEAQTHLESKRFKALTDVADEMSTCERLLTLLDKKTVEEIMIEELAMRNKELRPPLAYLGITAMLEIEYANRSEITPEKIRQEAENFVRAIQLLRSDRNITENTQAWINRINKNRLLHWVYGAGMFKALFGVLAERSLHTPYETQLKSHLEKLTMPMDFLSGFIYFFRLFGLELREAIEIAFANYQPEFAKTGFRFVEKDNTGNIHDRKHQSWKRLTKELDDRKYRMLNDLIWGAVNIITWRWLKGDLYTPAGGINAIGYAGGLLTLVLLVFDLAMALCSYLGKEKDYLTQKAQLEKAINDSTDEDVKKNKQAMLDKLNLDWKYEEYKCINQIVGAMAWLIGWTVLCAFFTPGFPAMIFVTLGAVVFLFLSIIVRGFVENQIDSAKLIASQAVRTKAAEALLQAFKKSDDINKKQDLYLQIKDLVAETEHDKKTVLFLRNKAIVQTILNALIPVIIFTTIVFLSTYIALIPIAVFFVIIYKLNQWIEELKPKAYQPTGELEAEFNHLLIKKEALTLDDFKGTISEEKASSHSHGYIPVLGSGGGGGGGSGGSSG